MGIEPAGELRPPARRFLHETIYTSLFVQAKAGLPGELTVQLRTLRVPAVYAQGA
jgi:hypothetical protein